jgi:hypothetical protein
VPIIDGGIERKSNTHQLDLIKQKKSALQRLIKLAVNLNRLNQGLQSILILGKSIIAIPPKVLNSFKTLSKKLEPLPTEKLQNTLSSTEIKIQNNIKQVLEISQKDESELSDYMAHKEELLMGSIEESFGDYVNDFKKKAQASIAIRIVLKTRDALMSTFLLPVPEAFIKKQITVLEKRESDCRQRIKKEMTDIYKEITTFIKDENCPDELREELLTTRNQITNNINHFNSGQDLESMPIIFESIELSSEPEPEKETTASDEPKITTQQEVEDITPSPIKRTLLSRLWEWITSPTGHSWSDINKNK